MARNAILMHGGIDLEGEKIGVETLEGVMGVLPSRDIYLVSYVPC